MFFGLLGHVAMKLVFRPIGANPPDGLERSDLGETHRVESGHEGMVGNVTQELDSQSLQWRSPGRFYRPFKLNEKQAGDRLRACVCQGRRRLGLPPAWWGLDGFVAQFDGLSNRRQHRPSRQEGKTQPKIRPNMEHHDPQ
jgi:hypothetical protein